MNELLKDSIKYLTEPDERHWVLDIECDDLEAAKIWCIVLENVLSGEVWSSHGKYLKEAFLEFLSEHPDIIFIGHNALSYDIPTLNRLLGLEISLDNVIDTLVLSYLYDPSMIGGHSLEAWGERLKCPKDTFSDFSQWSQQLQDRCTQDVSINKQVYLRLRKRMAQRGFSEASCWIEHNIRRVINDQQQTGFYFDKAKAIALRDKFDKERQRLSDDIFRLFPPVLSVSRTLKFKRKADGSLPAVYLRCLEEFPKVVCKEDQGEFDVYEWKEFNIASPKQRIDKLLSLGWKPTSFTPKGSPQTDETSLLDFAEISDHKQEVEAIAGWLVLTGRSNMIGTWLNNLKEDSRIHGKVFSCGAGTRRMTHSSPNSANIPGKDAKYGREVRQLWQASPGRVLVGYDAKALEMRVFGHYLNNTEAAKLYIEGDPHTLNTIELGYDPDENLPWRKSTKAGWYAMIYGALDPKLGSIFNKGRAFGKFMRETFMKTAPGLKELTEEVQRESESGFILCIDGGFVRCPHVGAALNYKIQSAGAILMKLASILLDKEIKKNRWDAKKVSDVHDEGQLDCAIWYAELVGKCAVECIRRAGKLLGFSVEMDGNYMIGPDWSQTH